MSTFKQHVIDKLYRTWIQYNNIKILVDFDDTLKTFNVTAQEYCDEILETLKECQKYGAEVMLYTCRDGKKLHDALDYCEQRDLFFDKINPCYPFQPDMSAKPFCNILLDDKAGLEQAFEILKIALQNYKKFKDEE